MRCFWMGSVEAPGSVLPTSAPPAVNPVTAVSAKKVIADRVRKSVRMELSSHVDCPPGKVGKNKRHMSIEIYAMFCPLAYRREGAHRAGCSRSRRSFPGFL